MAPEILKQLRRNAAKRSSLLLRKVRRFVLGEHGKQDNRKIRRMKRVDHAPSATLAPAANSNPHLAQSASALDQDALNRICSKRIDNRFALFFRQQLFRTAR